LKYQSGIVKGTNSIKGPNLMLIPATVVTYKLSTDPLENHNFTKQKLFQIQNKN
jgi:hypothetical protein